MVANLEWDPRRRAEHRPDKLFPPDNLGGRLQRRPEGPEDGFQPSGKRFFSAAREVGNQGVQGGVCPPTESGGV